MTEKENAFRACYGRTKRVAVRLQKRLKKEVSAIGEHEFFVTDGNAVDGAKDGREVCIKRFQRVFVRLQRAVVERLGAIA